MGVKGDVTQISMIPYFHISVNLCDQIFRPEQRNGERNEMSGEKEAPKTACRLLNIRILVAYFDQFFRSAQQKDDKKR